jgi:3-deoxy-7-phosphoheptulonate synthase
MEIVWILELELLDAAKHQEVSSFLALHPLMKETLLENSWQIQAKERTLLIKLIKSCCLVEQVHSLYQRQVNVSAKSQRLICKDDSYLGRSSIFTDRKSLTLIAGPCAVESEEQMILCAQALTHYKIEYMRTGIFKPRTSPHSFQGLGCNALGWLMKLKKEWPLKFVGEILDSSHIDQALQVIDIAQIGSRNMSNSHLLKTLAKSQVPVILKRGFSSTYYEWLMAAETLLHHGAKEVILCERGIRTFETHTRFTLDINAVAVMKELCHLPLIIDPSHSTGQRRWVMAACRAAVAAGANGLIVEVHPNPQQALSDSDQTLPLEALKNLVKMRQMFDWIQSNNLTD